jgi:hypothetical protein
LASSAFEFKPGSWRMVNGFVKQVQRCPRYFPRAKVLINAVTVQMKYYFTSPVT